MKPRQTPPKSDPRLRLSLVVTLLTLCLTVLLVFSGHDSNAQGQVQVTAADPSSTVQGTINLNVRVTGKGFKNGAQAKWFVTGTTNPGGVTVNSTTFVSSSELSANITVADDAVVANYDIQVQNSDGRGGKGTELFGVVPKGGGGGSNCPALPPAPTSDSKCYAALPGCMDTTFGINGMVTTDTNGPNINQDRAEAMVIQNDGKIVTAGSTYSTLSGTLSIDFLVVRYNTDGSLDTSFGDPDPLNSPLRLGYVITPISTNYDAPHAALLQPDGKIVVGGNSSLTASMVVARYNTDGTLDSTFGSGGKVFVDLPAVLGLAIQSDSKLLLAGYSGSDSFAVARLNPNGALDSSFATGGKLVVNPTNSKRGGRALANAIAIQRVPAVTGEERIVLGGYSDSGGGRVFTLMRFKPNGATDTTFGSNGRAYTSFFGFGDNIYSLTVDSANRIVAAGSTYIASSSCDDYVQDFAVARYTQDGALDNSFSGDGRLNTDVYGGSDWAQGVVLQPDGKIVVAGFAKSSDRTFWHFALVRYNPNGTPDSSFGILGTGIVTTHFAYPSVDHQVDWGEAVALQPWDGKIVVAGSANDVRLVALARYWP